jgi:hypothetical protein
MDMFIKCERIRWRREIIDWSPEARRKLGRRIRNSGNDANDSGELWGWMGNQKFGTRCCIYTRRELLIRSSWNWIFHSCWLWSGSASPASVSLTNLVMLAYVHESIWQLEVFLRNSAESWKLNVHYTVQQEGKQNWFSPKPKDTFVYSHISTFQLHGSCQFVCFWHDSPQLARTSSFTRFLDHT